MKSINELYNDIRVDLTPSLFHVQENLPCMTKQMQKFFDKDTSIEDKMKALEYLAEYQLKFKNHSNNIIDLIDDMQELAPKLLQNQDNSTESNKE